MEKLNRAQKCSILGSQNLGSRGGPMHLPGSMPESIIGPPPGSMPESIIHSPDLDYIFLYPQMNE